MATNRVDATEEALDLIDRLVAVHGPVLFHQSGGCCDGSSPMCFPLGEFRIGSSDVLLGYVGNPGTGGPDNPGVPFHMSGPQFEYWQHTHLTLDVVPGRGAGFSLEAPEGVRFMIRSRLFTDDETASLEPVTVGNGE
ncbi:MAG: uncharacterized protein JWM34_455 [Ilumatobacteraceae bacterium]|nr:uncharacterized protein [Ilumatobacteraceae bacterium]